MHLAKRKKERLGPVRYWLYFPRRLAGERLAGTLHAPRHAPECDIPVDNSGTVTVEAHIDTHGTHHYVRAWAEGDRIDRDVLQSCADLVCDNWHSDPAEYPDGSRCDLLDGEAIRLVVDFPIARSGRHRDIT